MGGLLGLDAKRVGVSVARDHVEQILAAAIQAPSGDNLQPWRFGVSGDVVLVSCDPQRGQPSFFNVLGRPNFAALGAAIENASLLAGKFGYEVMPTYFPDPRDPLLVAALALKPGIVRPDPLAAVIGQRVTNRLPYRRTPIPAATWSRIAELVGDATPGRLTPHDDPGCVRRLAATLSVAERLVVGNPRCHACLFETFRWTPEEARARRDGLPLDTLGASQMEVLMLRLVRSWERARVFGPLGLRAVWAHHGRSLVLRSSGLVSVGVPSVGELDFVLGGRLAQRVWLACTLAGLAVQPVTALIWAGLRVELLGGEGMASRERAEIGKAWGELREQLGLEGAWRPAMLLRVGFAPPPPGRTLRRPLGDCLAPGREES